MTWDLFCSVVDNYGDIGVTWRLARQLASEHGIPVRLWVDDLGAFHQIIPQIKPTLAEQHLAGVTVLRWCTPLAEATPGEVVIEALACNLPDSFLARMAAKHPPPVWLNLEYLSAEDWVAGVHGLPSPHPRLPLNKHFFMPGYTAGTGGLPRERWLSAKRDAFMRDANARAIFFAGLGLPIQSDDELRISLFSYENRALPALLQAWANDSQPVRVLVPIGKALPQIATWFGASIWQAGQHWQRGALELHVLPMLPQDDYDRLLWACDLNFVRGEDSCLRAQYAAKPLVWQAYVQDAEAHLAKLDALLDHYCAGLNVAPDISPNGDPNVGPDVSPNVNLNAELATLVREFWRAWNTESDPSALWPRWRAALPALTLHARDWDTQLAAQTDLAANLLTFCRKWLK